MKLFKMTGYVYLNMDNGILVQLSDDIDIAFHVLVNTSRLYFIIVLHYNKQIFRN